MGPILLFCMSKANQSARRLHDQTQKRIAKRHAQTGTDEDTVDELLKLMKQIRNAANSALDGYQEMEMALMSILSFAEGAISTHEYKPTPIDPETGRPAGGRW